MGTTLEQFRASLRNSIARAKLGLTMSGEEATWIADNEALSVAYYKRWLDSRLVPTIDAKDHPAPVVPLATPLDSALVTRWYATPGRTSGFVCGLIGVIFVAGPFLAIPLGIIGCVQSNKALRLIPYGADGRRLAVAGLTLSVIATSLSAFIMLLALPGAVERNF
jgi:hypothetical protein